MANATSLTPLQGSADARRYVQHVFNVFYIGIFEMKLTYFMFIILILASPSANAVVTNIVGLNKLAGDIGNELNYSIDRAKNVLFALEEKTNEDVKARIYQLDKIVDDAIKDINDLEVIVKNDVDEILEKAISEANHLEKKFMSDLNLAIDKVDCMITRKALQDMEMALGGLGDFVNTHRIKIDAPALYPGERQESCWFIGCKKYQKEFEIKEPFNVTYDEIKEFMLGRLKNSRKDTPVNTLITTYEYLADLSARASCLASSSSDRLRTDYIKFVTSAHHWKYVLGPEIGMSTK